MILCWLYPTACCCSADYRWLGLWHMSCVCICWPSGLAGVLFLHSISFLFLMLDAEDAASVLGGVKWLVSWLVAAPDADWAHVKWDDPLHLEPWMPIGSEFAVRSSC
ncbi:hypothetical protein Nepgr_033653 [Nepenthes gracilis]|uniref:Uncharacterized protein n=1 Tax=Nepenthes gracilis TaxID=150966 RepID=A0AAD3TM77_NEPGR|nr:hypothetical protein Nepgr_033653 [Nepenthes gracilis]